MKYTTQNIETGFIRSNTLNYVDPTLDTIDSSLFLDKHRRNPGDFTRNRKMPFPKLMRFMLSRSKASTQTALERFFQDLGEREYMTQQSFSDARYKIKESAFIELFRLSVDISYTGFFDTWNGYRVLAIDGSKIALPDVKLLGDIFGRLGADASSPTAQGSFCYDVLNRVVVDALIEPLSCDERTLAVQHIDNLSLTTKMEKNLVITDRGYPSFDFVQKLKTEGVSFIMRVKRGFSKEIDEMASRDKCIYLHSKGCPDIKVRVVKFRLPSGEIETLITDLFDRSIKPKHFKELYFFRWPIETKFDEIKNMLEIENFTGWSTTAIKQDFFATMYLTNVAMAAWWEAQLKVEQQRADKNNKYQYRVNINHEIGVLRNRFIYALTINDPIARSEEIKYIIMLLSKRVSAVKDGRSFPRSSPRKAKFHLNSKSNC